MAVAVAVAERGVAVRWGRRCGSGRRRGGLDGRTALLLGRMGRDTLRDRLRQCALLLSPPAPPPRARLRWPRPGPAPPPLPSATAAATSLAAPPPPVARWQLARAALAPGAQTLRCCWRQWPSPWAQALAFVFLPLPVFLAAASFSAASSASSSASAAAPP